HNFEYLTCHNLPFYESDVFVELNVGFDSGNVDLDSPMILCY
ncbi:2536_t:CDS:1, partial [Acaulospora morrowiae]